MKIAQKLARAIKKDRTVFASSAQVYGQNSPKTATYKGHFGNIRCTLLQLVASSFTPLPEKAGISGAVS